MRCNVARLARAVLQGGIVGMRVRRLQQQRRACGGSRGVRPQCGFSRVFVFACILTPSDNKADSSTVQVCWGIGATASDSRGILGIHIFACLPSAQQAV